jgi:hypothetical protein
VGIVCGDGSDDYYVYIEGEMKGVINNGDIRVCDFLFIGGKYGESF